MTQTKPEFDNEFNKELKGCIYKMSSWNMYKNTHLISIEIPRLPDGYEWFVVDNYM